MATNERDDVRRALDTSQAEIEDKLGYTRRRLDLRFQNVRLQRVEETLLEQLGRHLIRHGLPSFNEHFVGDAFRLRREDRHSNRREYVEVVSLSRQECLPIEVNRRKLYAGGIDRLAF